MFRTLLAGAALAALAVPALAQQAVPNPAPTRELLQDRGYDKHTPKHDAVDAQEQPTTQTLNKAVSAVSGENNEIAAEDMAQYDADREHYRAEVNANARQVMADETRYARQQAAYADAMRAWRAQSDACKRGSQNACNAPTPDPASFY